MNDKVKGHAVMWTKEEKEFGNFVLYGVVLKKVLKILFNMCECDMCRDIL